jgi:hypothetical protein
MRFYSSTFQENRPPGGAAASLAGFRKSNPLRENSWAMGRTEAASNAHLLVPLVAELIVAGAAA